MNQIKRMLNKAFDKFSKVDGLIFHSDQGWQYQHRVFRTALSDHGIIQSMSRKGNCYDNCIMETFFGRLKNELYYGHEKDFKSFYEFSDAIDEYIDYYNNKRIQVKTKWMPPKIQGSIHSFFLVHNVCPELWVHITSESAFFSAKTTNQKLQKKSLLSI